MIIPAGVDPDTMTYDEILEAIKADNPEGDPESATYLAKLLTGQASLYDAFDEDENNSWKTYKEEE